MADGEGLPAARPAGRKAYGRWSEGLGRRICERLAAGELLYVICREPGMPTAEGVAKWAKEKPAFAAALVSARRAGGRAAGSRGPVDTYCREVGEEVFQRLCEGESLTAIARDPAMPCLSTLMRWKRRIAEFAELVTAGKEAYAQRMCDDGWEMAMGATPETAYLTHVRLAHLRWMTGVMAPRQFRLKMVEPVKETEVIDVLFRHFKVERDPVTGRKVVVAYCPNPVTGELEREDQPGWRPPENAWLVAGGFRPEDPEDGDS